MDNIDNDEENKKAKKVRRILLLKTDQELKKNSKRYLNIMINSKTIQELNQAYNSYKILLSESSPIYSNYVQIYDNMFPEKPKIVFKEKEIIIKNREDQIIKSLNSSMESHSPAIDYIPNKIDLGKKKFSFMKKGSINNNNSPKIFEGIKSKENINREGEEGEEENKKIKSSKIGNKNIHKVIDKIVRIKLPFETEDDDNAITKNIIHLRKYCYKLKKRRKKNKKFNKPKVILSVKKQKKDRGIERPKVKKRKTVVNLHIYTKKSLFGMKDDGQETVLKREDTFDNQNNKKLDEKILTEEDNKFEKNNSNTNMHERKTYKMNSFKDLKTIREKTNADKKRNIRRIQTLNPKNQPVFINKLSQKKEIKKKDSILKQVNKILKEPIISTKITRPSKYVIINNNINNANIIFNKDVKKKNSLFSLKSLEFQRQKFIKEKDKEKDNIRSSMKRTVKHIVRLFNPEFHRINLPLDS